MATIYFTSNADSGDGTLRAAIASANDGDVITYDPAVFTTGPVVIALSSYLPIFPDNATLDGGELGIVIDGQNISMGGYSALRALSSLTVVNVTITRYKVTTNAPVYVNNASSSYIYKRCKFVENSGVWYGTICLTKGSISLYDCLIAGNVATGSATTSGGIAIAEGYTLDFVRSTLCGNRKGNIGSASLTRLNNINSFVGLTPPEFDGVTPEEIGFVNPPPSAAIPEADYTAGDWATWDFRLKPTSPYLTGAAYQSGDLDLLGHPRTGSWGAYDGSWFVVPANGTATIASNITVDYAEIGSGGTVNFSAANLFLSVKKSASVSSSVWSAPTGGNGYLAVPVGTNVNAATLTRVKAAAYGAGVDNLDYVYPDVYYSASDMTIPVLLEYRVGSSGAWTTVANIAESPYTYAVTSTRNIRLFDGIGFYTAVAESPEPGPGNSYYELAAKTNVGYLIAKSLTGYLKTKDTVGYLN